MRVSQPPIGSGSRLSQDEIKRKRADLELPEALKKPRVGVENQKKAVPVTDEKQVQFFLVDTGSSFKLAETASAGDLQAKLEELLQRVPEQLHYRSTGYGAPETLTYKGIIPSLKLNKLLGLKDNNDGYFIETEAPNWIKSNSDRWAQSSAPRTPFYERRQTFLGLLDKSIKRSLLGPNNHESSIQTTPLISSLSDNGTLLNVDGLLSAEECDKILAQCKEFDYEKMTEKYLTQQRNNKRMIVMDRQFAEMISNRLEPLIKPLGLPTTPLGFSVEREWTLQGANAAIRINHYDEATFFSLHRDSQYCPNGDERSLFSVVIYLNDDFMDGETQFFFPEKELYDQTRGVSIEEEVAIHGGLEEGYNKVSVKPKKGSCVVFNHNILHAATPPSGVRHPPSILSFLHSSPLWHMLLHLFPPHESDGVDRQGTRTVIRLDLMVRRAEKPAGFQIAAAEEKDYHECLMYFKEAQKCELSGFKETANELYERCLAVRYAYPRMLLKQKAEPEEEDDFNCLEMFPLEIWKRILTFVHDADARATMLAFPVLWKLKHELKENTAFTRASEPRDLFLPKIKSGGHGLECLFPNEAFLEDNLEGCLRVCAVLAFFSATHKEDTNSYYVRYDQDTQTAIEVSRDDVLADAFYNRKSYGSIYTLREPHKKNPQRDFEENVDRTYMANRHGAQFLGQDFFSKWNSRTESDYEKPNRGGTREPCPWDDEGNKGSREEGSMDVEEGGSNDDYDPYDDDYSYNPPTIQSFVDSLSRNGTLCRYGDHGEKNAFLGFLMDPKSNGRFSFLDTPGSTVSGYCGCGMDDQHLKEMEWVDSRNALVFDFENFGLEVKSAEEYKCPQSRVCMHWSANPRQGHHWIVDITNIQKETGGINHASCNCNYPEFSVAGFSFLGYEYLSHVHCFRPERGRDDTIFINKIPGRLNWTWKRKTIFDWLQQSKNALFCLELK